MSSQEYTVVKLNANPAYIAVEFEFEGLEEQTAHGTAELQVAIDATTLPAYAAAGKLPQTEVTLNQPQDLYEDLSLQQNNGIAFHGTIDMDAQPSAQATKTSEGKILASLAQDFDFSLSPLSSISRASSVDESTASPAADGAVFVDNGLFDDINSVLSRMNPKANSLQQELKGYKDNSEVDNGTSTVGKRGGQIPESLVHQCDNALLDLAELQGMVAHLDMQKAPKQDATLGFTRGFDYSSTAAPEVTSAEDPCDLPKGCPKCVTVTQELADVIQERDNLKQQLAFSQKRCDTINKELQASEASRAAFVEQLPALHEINSILDSLRLDSTSMICVLEENQQLKSDLAALHIELQLAAGQQKGMEKEIEGMRDLYQASVAGNSNLREMMKQFEGTVTQPGPHGSDKRISGAGSRRVSWSADLPHEQSYHVADADHQSARPCLPIPESDSGSAYHAPLPADNDLAQKLKITEFQLGVLRLEYDSMAWEVRRLQAELDGQHAVAQELTKQMSRRWNDGGRVQVPQKPSGSSADQSPAPSVSVENIPPVPQMMLMESMQESVAPMKPFALSEENLDDASMEAVVQSVYNKSVAGPSMATGTLDIPAITVTNADEAQPSPVSRTTDAKDPPLPSQVLEDSSAMHHTEQDDVVGVIESLTAQLTDARKQVAKLLADLLVARQNDSIPPSLQHHSDFPPLPLPDKADISLSAVSDTDSVVTSQNSSRSTYFAQQSSAAAPDTVEGTSPAKVPESMLRSTQYSNPMFSDDQRPSPAASYDSEILQTILAGSKAKMAAPPQTGLPLTKGSLPGKHLAQMQDEMGSGASWTITTTAESGDSLENIANAIDQLQVVSINYSAATLPIPSAGVLTSEQKLKIGGLPADSDFQPSHLSESARMQELVNRKHKEVEKLLAANAKAAEVQRQMQESYEEALQQLQQDKDAADKQLKALSMLAGSTESKWSLDTGSPATILQERDSAREQLAAATAELDTIKEMKPLLEKNCMDLQSKLETTQAELTALQAEISRMESQHSKQINQEISKDEQHEENAIRQVMLDGSDNFRECIDRLESEQSALREKIEHKENQCTQYEKQILQLQLQLEQEQSMATKLSELLGCEQRAQLQEQLEKLVSQHATLLEQMRHSQSECAQYQHNILQLQDQLQQERHHAKKQTELDDAEHAELQGHIKRLEAEHAELQEQITRGENERVQHEKKILKLKQEHDATKDEGEPESMEHAQLRQHIGRLENERADLQERLIRAGTERAERLAQMRRVETERAACEQKMLRLQSQVRREHAAVQMNSAEADKQQAELTAHASQVEIQYEKLQERIRSVEHECTGLQTELAQLQSERNQLHEQITAIEAESKALQEEVRRGAVEQEKLRELISKAESENTDLQKQLKLSEAHNSEIQEHLHKCEADLATFQERLTACEAKNAKLVEEINTLGNERAQLQKQATEHKAEREKLLESIIEKDVQHTEDEQKIVQLLGQLQQETEASKERHQHADSEISRLREEVTLVESEHAKLVEKIRNVEKEKMHCEQKILQLQEVLANEEVDKVVLKEFGRRASVLEDEATTLQRKLVIAENEITSLEAELAARSKLLEQSQESMMKLEAEVADAAKKSTEALEEVARLESDLIACQARAAASDQQSCELAHTLQIAMQEAAVTDADLSLARADFLAAQAELHALQEYRNAAYTLKEQLDDVTALNSSLQLRCQELESNLMEESSNRKGFEESCSNLRQQVTDLAAQKDLHELRCNSLEERLHAQELTIEKQQVELSSSASQQEHDEEALARAAAQHLAAAEALAETQAKLAETRRQLDDATAVSHQLKHDVADLADKLSSAESYASHLEVEANHNRQELDGLQDKVAKLEIEASVTVVTLAAYGEEKSNLQLELADAHAQVASGKQMIDSLHADISDALKNLAVAEECTCALKAELSNAQAGVSIAEQKVDLLQGQLDEANQAMHGAEERQSSLMLELEKIKDELQSVVLDRNALLEQHSQLKTKLEVVEAALVASQESNSSLLQEKLKADDYVTQSRVAAREAHADQEVAKRTLSELAQHSAATEQKAAALQAVVEEAQEILIRKDKLIAELDLQISNKDATIADLAEKKDKTAERLDGATQQLLVLTMEHKELFSKHDMCVKHLQEKDAEVKLLSDQSMHDTETLKEVTCHLENLRDKLSGAAAEARTWQLQLQNEQEKVGNLEAKLTEAIANYNELQHQLLELQSQLEESRLKSNKGDLHTKILQAKFDSAMAEMSILADRAKVAEIALQNMEAQASSDSTQASNLAVQLEEHKAKLAAVTNDYDEADRKLVEMTHKANGLEWNIGNEQAQHEQELSLMRNVIEQLEAELGAASETVAGLRKVCKEIESTAASKEQLVIDIDAELIAKQKVIDDLTVRCDANELELRDVKALKAELAEKTICLQQQVDVLSSDIQHAAVQLAAASGELAIKQRKLDEVQEEVQKAVHSLDLTQQQLQAAESKIAALEEGLQAAESAAAAAAHARDQGNQALDQKQQHLQQKDEELLMAKEVLLQVQQQVEEAAAQASKSSETIMELQAVAEAAEQSAWKLVEDEMLGREQKASDEINRLVNHTALLAQEVASQKKVIKELRWQVSDAEEQLSASQAQAALHQQSMEALQGETSTLQAQWDSANSAVEATRNELRAAHMEVVELNQKLLKHEQSIESLAQEKIELQRQLAAQKEEVAAKGKVLKELHHQLAEEQRVSLEYSQQLQEKEEGIAALHSKLEEHEKASSKHQEETALLQSQLQAAEQRCIDFESQLEGQNNLVEALEAKIASNAAEYHNVLAEEKASKELLIMQIDEGEEVIAELQEKVSSSIAAAAMLDERDAMLASANNSRRTSTEPGDMDQPNEADTQEMATVGDAAIESDVLSVDDESVARASVQRISTTGIELQETLEAADKAIAYLSLQLEEHSSRIVGLQEAMSGKIASLQQQLEEREEALITASSWLSEIEQGIEGKSKESDEHLRGVRSELKALLSGTHELHSRLHKSAVNMLNNADRQLSNTNLPGEDRTNIMDTENDAPRSSVVQGENIEPRISSASTQSFASSTAQDILDSTMKMVSDCSVAIAALWTSSHGALAASQQQLEELQELVSSLRSQLDASQKSATGLSVELQEQEHRHIARAVELKSQLCHWKHAAEELRMQLDSSENGMASLQQDLQVANDRVKQLEAELSVKSVSIEKQLKLKSSLAAELELQLNSAEGAINNLLDLAAVNATGTAQQAVQAIGVADLQLGHELTSQQLRGKFGEIEKTVCSWESKLQQCEAAARALLILARGPTADDSEEIVAILRAAAAAAAAATGELPHPQGYDTRELDLLSVRHSASENVNFQQMLNSHPEMHGQRGITGHTTKDSEPKDASMTSAAQPQHTQLSQNREALPATSSSKLIRLTTTQKAASFTDRAPRQASSPPMPNTNRSLKHNISSPSSQSPAYATQMSLNDHTQTSMRLLSPPPPSTRSQVHSMASGRSTNMQTSNTSSPRHLPLLPLYPSLSSPRSVSTEHKSNHFFLPSSPPGGMRSSSQHTNQAGAASSRQHAVSLQHAQHNQGSALYQDAYAEESLSQRLAVELQAAVQKLQRSQLAAQWSSEGSEIGGTSPASTSISIHDRTAAVPGLEALTAQVLGLSTGFYGALADAATSQEAAEARGIQNSEGTDCLAFEDQLLLQRSSSGHLQLWQQRMHGSGY